MMLAVRMAEGSNAPLGLQTVFRSDAIAPDCCTQAILPCNTSWWRHNLPKWNVICTLAKDVLVRRLAGCRP